MMTYPSHEKGIQVIIKIMILVLSQIS
jgi:hypothetical protein